MNYIDWIGFIGVFLILLAYTLNISGRFSNKNIVFIILNFVGASLACLASILLNYWPFIILEAVWALVSLFALWSFVRNHPKP